jgi:hypothetical protein
MLCDFLLLACLSGAISHGRGGVHVYALAPWTGPARTIRVEAEYWITDDWYRSLTQCDIAISSNGSHHARCEFTNFDYLVFSNKKQTMRILTLQHEHKQFRIDDSTRTADPPRS